MNCGPASLQPFSEQADRKLVGAVAQLAEHHDGIGPVHHSTSFSVTSPINHSQNESGLCQFLPNAHGLIAMEKVMQTRNVSLLEAVEVTVELKTKANRRKKYVDGLGQYLRLFARGREDLPVADISVDLIEDWFASRSEKPATRAANLGRIAAMCSVAWRRGWMRENPCDKVERVTVDKQSPRILSLPQIYSLLHAMQNRRGIAYIILCLFAGLRPSEAQQLTWDKVDLSAGTVTVDASISKVRRRRIVHLMPAAVAWLRSSTQDVLPVSNRERKRILYLCCHILGFDSWPQDVYRHSCASYWIAECQDAGRVALQLGNSPKVLLTDYRELVTRAQAKEFWAIRPHVNGKQMELRL